MGRDGRTQKANGEEDTPFLARSYAKATAKRTLWYRYCLALIFGLSLFLNIISLEQLTRKESTLDRVCNDYTSESHSLITDNVDISYQTVQFDGRFTHQSIFTSPPSDEVEQAWLDIGEDIRLAVVPHDQGDRYGISPGHVKLRPEQGGGYPILFEFHHYLHCLNILRMTSWFHFEYYNSTGKHGFAEGEDIVREHTSHCINTLRQVIMCNADTGALGQIWVEGRERPAIDFNTKHKCKNFDAILETAKKLQSPEGTRLLVRKQEGDIVVSEIP